VSPVHVDTLAMRRAGEEMMRALFVVGAMFLAQPVFAQSNEK